MTSRTKKRIVLPSRPEPPSVEQILEDVRGAIASDPVFNYDLSNDSLLPTHDGACVSEREKQYGQSCSYVEINNKLKEAQIQLKGTYMCSAHCTYDFCLWYCPDDADLATCIANVLEQNGFRGYAEHRDKAAGAQAISAATDVIEASRISFLILSARSLHDPWYQCISQWNLVNFVDKEAAKVVPIYVGVEEEQRPPILKFLTSLNYNSKFFQKKLLDSMKRMTHH